jgi:hypothetical protein
VCLSFDAETLQHNSHGVLKNVGCCQILKLAAGTIDGAEFLSVFFKVRCDVKYTCMPR